MKSVFTSLIMLFCGCLMAQNTTLPPKNDQASGQTAGNRLDSLNKAAAALEKAGDVKGAATSYVETGNLCYRLKRIGEAETAYRQALRLDSTRADHWFLIGAALYDQKVKDEAEYYFNKAIGLDSNHVQSLNYLGTLCLSLGRNVQASQLLQRSVNINPNFPNSWNSLGTAYRSLKLPEAAITAFYKALGIDTANYVALINLAQLYIGEQRYKDAEQFLNRARKVNGKDPVLWNTLSLVHRRMKDYDTAETELHTAILLSPDLAASYIAMAAIKSLKGEVQSSLNYLEEGFKRGYKDFEAIAIKNDDYDAVRKAEGFLDLMKKYFPERVKG